MRWDKYKYTNRETPTQSNSAALEDTLMMRQWGAWANERIERELGHKVQPCFRQYQPPGWRESNLDTGIDEEYAQVLDAMIAAIFHDQPFRKSVVMRLYVDRFSIKRLARAHKKNEHQIRQERDIALGMLYGALSYKIGTLNA